MSSIKREKSIQRQYTLVATLLGAIVIALSILVSYDEIRKANSLTANVEHSSRLLRLMHNIKNHYVELQRDLDKFMLEPEKVEHNSVFADTVQQLKQHIHELQTQLETYTLPSKLLLASINNSLDNLNKLIERLTHTRLDANSQYPALGVSTTEMRPIRNTISSTLSTLISEYLENDVAEKDPEIFNTLINAQKLWLSTISEYRLYLANRLGSFEEQGLIAQEDLIESYLDEFHQVAVELVAKNNGTTFGFEGSLIIDEIPSLIKDWGRGFLQVKRINHSDNWRQDTKLMSNHIIPLIAESLNKLEELENELQNQIAADLHKLGKVGTNLIFVLSFVILFFLMYIFASIYSLKKLVINPIAEISRTLKNNAIGKTRLYDLNIKRTLETQDLIEAFSEMEHQVYQRQSKLEEQALQDGLTNLPNRLMLQERLDYQIKISTRENQHFSLLMLDLNHFKEVNDTLGHHIGDQLLIQVGQRLKSSVRDTDTVARLGGDEFAVLLPGTSREFAAIIARKISQSIKTPFVVHSYNLNISTSIGITEFPADTDERNTLMQFADVAMYCSKRSNDEFCYYDANVDDYTVDRLSLANDLRNAIHHDEIELYYQPKIDLKTRQVFGAEALLRWRRDNAVFISPELIVDTAEKAGLIDDLSLWIIRRVAQDHHAFRQALKSLAISINIAVQNLRNTSFHLDILRIQEEFKLDSSLITLEITEHGMMTNPEQSIGILNELDNLGFELSIDDFGTGFSSLAYLKQLPVSELKIDKSFIMEMVHDESDRQIVKSTIQLAHTLGLGVVAEGVENIETLELISEMGCDAAQGYFFSRPLSKKDFLRYLHLEDTPSAA